MTSKIQGLDRIAEEMQRDYDRLAARDGVVFDKYPRCPECGDYHDRKRITCEQLDAIRDAEDAAGWPRL